MSQANKCDRCGSERVIYINGHCVDCFGAEFQGKEYDGYVPRELGIGHGDDIEMGYCLDCGKIQGKFPITELTIFDGEEDDEG